MTRNFYKTIGLFLYCQHVVKFLRELFSTLSLNVSKKIVFSLQINLVFVHSCKNQLSIVHDIYANFDQHPTLEMRANFLNISKAFDKVWHEALLFKLEHIGISGNLLSLLKSFLSDRFQRVVLNGQCSSWSSVLAGVPKVLF